MKSIHTLPLHYYIRVNIVKRAVFSECNLCTPRKCSVPDQSQWSELIPREHEHTHATIIWYYYRPILLWLVSIVTALYKG